MDNSGVACNVCECKHNEESCKCNLSKIQITHEKTGADAIATPHFCKSFEKK